MRRNFPVSEKSVNFEQTGKVRENHIKYWKTQGISDKCYLIFLVIFKLTLYYLLKWIKFSVKKQNIKKILKKWESCVQKPFTLAVSGTRTGHLKAIEISLNHTT